MRRLPKIRLVVFLLTLLIFSVFFSPKPTRAVDSYVNYDLKNYDADIEKAIQNPQTVSFAPLAWFQGKGWLTIFIKFIIPTSNLQASSGLQQTALGNISLVMATMYQNPPASFAFYTRDFLANAGFIQPVQAQGIGFAAMTPLLSLWKASRNIAYAVLIIVMIAIGFMIIFRMKIDPKTVISIQAALPKIILTLILITLSYPIVGFLIDVMYLSMAILISLMAQGMGGSFATKVSELQTQYMTGGLATLFGSVFSGGFRSVDDFIKGYAGQIGGVSGLAVLISLLPNVVAPGLGTAAVAAAPSALLLLILALGLLFTFIRLMLLLLNAYIQVLISLILGPIQLLMEAVPGKSAFSEWILNIIANLVVFPATAAILMFGMFLTSLNPANMVWNPPLLGIGTPPVFSAFIGIGVLFMAPTLVASIKKMFAPKPALPVSPGTIMAPLTGSFQTVMGAASQLYYGKMFIDMLHLGGGGGQPTPGHKPS